jgi:hypothetical protein
MRPNLDDPAKKVTDKRHLLAPAQSFDGSERGNFRRCRLSPRVENRVSLRQLVDEGSQQRVESLALPRRGPCVDCL